MASALLQIYAISWAEGFNTYVVWLMMPYLTDVWELNFTPAAAIVNLWRGAKKALPIFMLYLVDTVTGEFWMIFLSSTANTAGLGLLSMSAPRVLAKETESSTSYISHGRILFFLSLFLTAIGMSGLKSSLSSFLRKHYENRKKQESSTEKGAGECLALIAMILVPSAAAISLSYINPWSIKFGLPAILTMVSILVFLSGSCHYNREPASGSPFTIVFRVFVAATSKRFMSSPLDANQLYEIDAANADQSHFLPHTDSLSCLDKAAIILPNQPLEQQESDIWRLCRVTEVEETKIVIHCIPMCFCFIICGLVSAIGHTYFMSQASDMSRTSGDTQYPLLLLPFCCELIKSQYTRFYKRCARKPSKYVPIIEIGVSMILAALCCILAANVEGRRLNVVKRYGLIDKPNAVIPIFFGCLLPQFALLGLVDGMLENGIAGFFASQVPPSIAQNMTYLSEGVRGVGTISSVLSVFVVGKISEKGGKRPNWFQDSLNKSHLDYYYRTLAAMVTINLVFYIFMASRFKYRDASDTVHDVESPDFSETLQELATQDPDN